MLPPIYSKDPGVPGTLEVGYLGPMWKNTQYTAIIPAGGTGLQGVGLAISEVTFCADEKDAHRSLAPIKGDGVIYPPKWYDKSGKPLENLNAAQPDNPSGVPLDCNNEPGEDPSGPENKLDEEVKPNNTAGNGSGKEDDAKSKEASSSESNSDSGNSDSSSGSGSEDSSQDSASSKSGSSEGDANSDAQSDAPKCKVRWKKKPHQSSNVESG